MTQEHRSTMRALSIFELLAFGDNSEGYTLTEIATKLRAPKSSISPIIHTLTTNRYLKYNSDTARYIVLDGEPLRSAILTSKMMFFIRRPFLLCKTLPVSAPKLVISVNFRGKMYSI